MYFFSFHKGLVYEVSINRCTHLVDGLTARKQYCIFCRIVHCWFVRGYVLGFNIKICSQTEVSKTLLLENGESGNYYLGAIKYYYFFTRFLFLL